VADHKHVVAADIGTATSKGQITMDLGVMITVGIFGVSIVASAAVAQYQIHAQGVRLDEIEVQQKTDHDTLTRIRVDVSWIRKALEKKDG